MLLAIRDRITGIIAWVVVALISIPFMLWGVQEYFGAGQDRFAVKVNDSEVSYQEYDRLLTQNRQQLLQSFGGKLPGYFDVEKYMRQQSLDQLINRELFTQYMDEYRFRVPAEQILQAIMAESQFQLDGKFAPEFYTAELRSIGLSKRAYEAQLQDQIEARQLEAGLRNTAFVAKQELDDFAKLQHQLRDFEFLQLTLAKQQGKDIPVSEQEIADYFADEKNKAGFMTAERVTIDYVELSLKQLADEVAVDEQVLKQQYDTGIERGQFQTDEVRTASHILIKVPADAADDVVADKRALIEELRKKIMAGDSFEDVAKANSEDPGSAAQNGSLGEVSRGVMVKPFEDALFALQADMISEPVKTRFGFHLIRVDDIQQGVVRPYEELRAGLEKDYRNQQAEQVFYEKLDTLETLAYESSDLTAAAEAVDTQLKSSTWFGRDAGTGIAQYPEVRQAAFSEQILQDGLNSRAIEIQAEHVVFLRVAKHEPAQPQALEQAKSKIVARLKNQKANTALAELAQTVLQRARAGEPLNKLAKQYKAEYKTLEKAKRDTTDAPREVVQAVFRVPMLTGDVRRVDQVNLANGDIAVASVSKVADGDIKLLSDQEKQQLVAQLAQQRGQYDLGAMIAGLREKAEIVINEELQK